MKLIVDKQNTVPPGGDYIFGSTRDDDGSNNGTPSNFDTWNDFFEFFDSLMATAAIPDADAGAPIVANHLLDNNTNGYQIIQALRRAVRTYYATEFLRGTLRVATQTETNTGAIDTAIVTPNKLNSRTATEGRTGIAEIADQTEVNAGTDDERIITPLKLATYLGAWTLRTDVGDVTFSSGTGNVCNSCNIKYKIIGKTMHMIYEFQVTNTTAPTGISLKIPASKISNVGFFFYAPTTIYQSASLISGRSLITSGTGILSFDLFALGNGTTSDFSGQLTFEIE